MELFVNCKIAVPIQFENCGLYTIKKYNMDKAIYLDYSSTTPVDPRVMEVMKPYFTDFFGNASSKSHSFGWVAEEAVARAGEELARLLSVSPEELYFTSGATESINLAIKGVFELYGRKGKHIISSKSEHRAVLDCLEWVEKRGGEVSWLEVGPQGEIDLDQLAGEIRIDTVMVCLMWGNNETGALHPIEKIGSICREQGVLFFSDATQSVGKIPVHPKLEQVDILAFSGHKFYGPKGVGGIYVSSKNPRVKLQPLIHGGGQQGGVRAGTLNVPGIVGLGAAAAIAEKDLNSESQKLKELRNHLESELTQRIPSLWINGGEAERLPFISNISFKGVRSSDFLGKVGNTLAVSSGSACNSANARSSHVLRSMNLEEERLQSAFRFSLGRFTTEEEIKNTVDIVVDKINYLRSINPLWGTV